jgi:hypothetical protein
LKNPQPDVVRLLNQWGTETEREVVEVPPFLQQIKRKQETHKRNMEIDAVGLLDQWDTEKPEAIHTLNLLSTSNDHKVIKVLSNHAVKERTFYLKRVVSGVTAASLAFTIGTAVAFADNQDSPVPPSDVPADILPPIPTENKHKPKLHKPKLPKVDLLDAPSINKPDRPVAEDPEPPAVNQPEPPIANKQEAPAVDKPETPIVSDPEPSTKIEPKVPKSNPEPPVSNQPDRPVVDTVAPKQKEPIIAEEPSLAAPDFDPVPLYGSVIKTGDSSKKVGSADDAKAVANMPKTQDGGKMPKTASSAPVAAAAGLLLTGGGLMLSSRSPKKAD